MTPAQGGPAGQWAQIILWDNAENDENKGTIMLKTLRHQVNVLESVATSSFAAWRGCLVIKAVPQPEKPLVLYDIEACPYCRRVREVLTALHLDVEIRPCPKGGRVFRPEAEALGGARSSFPPCCMTRTPAKCCMNPRRLSSICSASMRIVPCLATTRAVPATGTRRCRLRGGQ